LQIPFFGIESWDDESTIKTYSSIFNGNYYSAIILPQTSDILSNEIKKRCSNCDIMPGTLQSYDAVFVLAEAIKKSGLNVEAVKQSLYKTSYDGLSGYIEFDANGDLKQTNYQIKKIEQDKIITIYP